MLAGGDEQHLGVSTIFKGDVDDFGGKDVAGGNVSWFDKRQRDVVGADTNADRRANLAIDRRNDK